jgi:hypothetical protein
MKKSFEEYLDFIEHELGCKLLDWQKTVLRNEYDGKHYYYNFGRISGKYVVYQAALMLKEEMARDTGNLPSRQYELDGYAINVVTCDENWGENIEWEKEK